ncbi:MAG: FtsX-like permease family protein [Hyphomicrobiaceae bacterium]|nr:FtsX-like permease family protein [Hyphomicrobiaceae bacterium]
MNTDFMSDLKLAHRLALRELRGGLSGFYVLVICIMLGVMAITTVGVLSTALRAGLGEQGRVLLGGDLSFGLIHRPLKAEQRTYLRGFGRTSSIANLRSMSRRVDGSRAVLVDVKAVDQAWPLIGKVVLGNASPFAGQLQAGDTAIVDALLLQRLGLKIGERFVLGVRQITIADTLEVEPDRLSGRLNFGPRVLISKQTLARTGLVQPGSLVRYTQRLLLDEKFEDGKKGLAAIKKKVKEKFPQAGFNVLDRTNPTPGITRAINRLSQFLALISLAALFIGGVGVANGVASHMGKKRTTIATFKSLGASGRLIFSIYLLQILMLAGLGIVSGLLLGLVIPPLLNLFLADSLPVQLQFGLPLGAVGLATLYGVLVAMLFALWPLGSARTIRAAELYRAHISSKASRPGRGIILLMAALLLVLAFVTILTSNVRLISLAVCVAFISIYMVFLGVARLTKWALVKAPRPANPQLAMVRASLTGPTPLLRTIMLSLGVGLTLLVTVSLVQHSLSAELENGLPSDAPNFFVLDIDKSDIEQFKNITTKLAPGAKINTAPMLRGRLIELAGLSVEKVKPARGSAWVLRGDRGLTFADTLPKGSELVKGKWWPKNYDGEPLVSFEAKIAKGLGLKMGDTVVVNVLGRDIKARIANLRRVKWESLSINFVMTFSSNTLKAAPYKLLSTITLPERSSDKEDVAIEGQLISKLVSALPDITPIAVREVLAAIDKVLVGVLMAVKVANLVLLLVGAVALAGAMAATHNARLRETVIFKVLGATRKWILTVHLLEYLALSALAIAVSLALGSLLAFLIVTYAMELPFAFSGTVAASIIALVLALILPLGLLGSWRILGQSSTRHLREA